MIRLTLSANAGGALQLGQHRLLVDALHSGKVPGFSTLDKALRTAVLAHPDFTAPELICLTHDHPDHYSGSLVAQAMALWPQTRLCRPQEMLQYSFDDMELIYFPLPHDGAQYAKVAHHGIFITWQGKHILIPGDCPVADEGLLRFVNGRHIDLAVLNFPWLTLKKGRECLENLLKPKSCVFWHLPFSADDVNGYRKSAEAALLQFPGVLLYDPLQTIEIDI